MVSGAELTVAGTASALPVSPRPYHAFAYGPRFRWWRPLVAIALGAVFFLLVSLPLAAVGLLADAGGRGLDPRAVALGPWAFLGNNLGLALMVPVAAAVHRVAFGQAPRWLISIRGAFDWAWAGTCLAVVAPLWLLTIAAEYALMPPQGLQVRWYSGLILVTVLVTTPLQSAGEEFLLRGLLARAVGSWWGGREAVGLAVSTAVSAAVFMVLHAAADPWLNAYYLVFGVGMSILVWRTGGLEAAIVIHATNNVMAEAVLPFVDIAESLNRSAGVGSPLLAINMGLIAAATLILARLARRRGLPVRTDPGRLATIPATPAHGA